MTISAPTERKEAVTMRLIDADAFKMEDFRHCLDCDSIIQVIKYAPTIEAEPVKYGRWKKDDLVWDETPSSNCSCCGQGISDECINWFKYCPNCGAKMDGDGNA
jgi:hypothetical protein